MLVYDTDMTELLGELEQLVLLAVVRLGPDSSGVPIIEELRQHTRRAILRPSVYLALRRLEDKGMIRSRLGDPEPRRGGRARRHFQATAAGVKALREAQRTVSRLLDGVALDKFGREKV